MKHKGFVPMFMWFTLIFLVGAVGALGYSMFSGWHSYQPKSNTHTYQVFLWFLVSGLVCALLCLIAVLNRQIKHRHQRPQLH